MITNGRRRQPARVSKDKTHMPHQIMLLSMAMKEIMDDSFPEKNGSRECCMIVVMMMAMISIMVIRVVAVAKLMLRRW